MRNGGTEPSSAPVQKQKRRHADCGKALDQPKSLNYMPLGLYRIPPEAAGTLNAVSVRTVRCQLADQSPPIQVFTVSCELVLSA
tara:strand:+ start:1829 stop:2080 length:252 start_codon:yes stop_codon:yes gene_type:complete